MTTQQPSFTKQLTSRETVIIFGVWFSITIFVLTIYPWSEFLSSWTITIPAGWVMYHLSFRWLFPKSLTFRFSYLFYATCILMYCIAIFFTQAMFLSMFIEDEEFFMGMGGIAIFILFFILAPVQWFTFKRLAR